MKELSGKELQEACDNARDMSERYYGMFLNSNPSWFQDLRAVGKTDEEIIKEFITTAYWYGYMDGKTNESVC